MIQALVTRKNGEREWIDPVLEFTIYNGYHHYGFDIAEVLSIELKEVEQ